MKHHGPGFPYMFIRLALRANHLYVNGFRQRAKTLIERGFQMRQVSRLQILSLVVLAVFLASYASGPARAAEPIKIGGLFELTGFLNPIGKDAQQGAMIAIEQEGGKLMGRPLEFIVEDSATDPSTTMDKARKLVEVDKVKIIVGPIFGPCTTGLAGYGDKVQIPLISIAPLDDAVILQNKWSFSTPGTDTGMGYPMGVFAATKLGYRRVATLGSDFEAGHEFIGGFVQGFQENGGKIIQQQWSPPGSTNMMPFLIAVDKQADALCAWWPGAEGFSGFKQYTELKMKLPIMEPEDGGTLASPLVTKGLGEGAIGAYTAVLYSYLADKPGNKEFVAAYQKKYGVAPGPIAGCGYAAVKIALEGLKRAGLNSSSQKLRDVLMSLKMDSVRGPVDFQNRRVTSYTAPIVRIDQNYVPQIVAEYRTKIDIVGGKFVYSLEK